MIAAALLGYAALLLFCGPLALAHVAWPDRAPRLAIAAWLALAWSAVASVVLSGVILALPAVSDGAGLARLLAACVLALPVDLAYPGGTAPAGAGAVLALAVTGRLAWCVMAVLGSRWRSGRRHQRGLRLAGYPDARLGAIVVEHEEPAAYCLPGAGRPVVLTTAALRALDHDQVTAVLAHERAHQTGRHHLLLSAAASLPAAFPRVPAFRRARDEVARLTELAADDAAAALSPRLTVARALLALGSPPAGYAALGAGGSTAAARVRRLIAAPNPLSRAAAVTGTLAVSVLTLFPALLVVGPAVLAVVTRHCAHV